MTFVFSRFHILFKNVFEKPTYYVVLKSELEYLIPFPDFF